MPFFRLSLDFHLESDLCFLNSPVCFTLWDCCSLQTSRSRQSSPFLFRASKLSIAQSQFDFEHSPDQDLLKSIAIQVVRLACGVLQFIRPFYAQAHFFLFQFFGSFPTFLSKAISYRQVCFRIRVLRLVIWRFGV